MECHSIKNFRIVEERMNPGIWEDKFFLHENQSIYKIIDHDLNILDCLCITNIQIVDKLESIIYGEQDKKFRVFPYVDSIFSTCPFSTEFHERYEKILHYNITNLETNESLNIAELQIHLIREHGFFGGLETRMRLEPRYLINFLDLYPGVDYASKILRRWKWKPIENRETLTQDEITKFKNYLPLALISDFYDGVQWMVTVAPLPSNIPPGNMTKYSNWMELFMTDRMKDIKNHEDPKYEASIKEIENEIEKKVKIIDRYKKTHLAEDLFLIIYNPQKKNLQMTSLGVRVIVSDIFHLFILIRETQFK